MELPVRVTLCFGLLLYKHWWEYSILKQLKLIWTKPLSSLSNEAFDFINHMARIGSIVRTSSNGQAESIWPRQTTMTINYAF